MRRRFSLWHAAAEEFDYPVTWDVRDVISLDDVAEVSGMSGVVCLAFTSLPRPLSVTDTWLWAEWRPGLLHGILSQQHAGAATLVCMVCLCLLTQPTCRASLLRP